MSAPTSTWRFIFSNSAAVSLPGLFRMCSGTASFPVSCRSAAASIAFNSSSSVMPSARARPIAYACTRTHVAVRHVVFRVDRHRQRLDRGQVQLSTCARCRRASSTRPNDACSVRWKTTSSGMTIARRSKPGLLNQQHQTERQRCRREVADGQPLEMLPPDGAGDCASPGRRPSPSVPSSARNRRPSAQAAEDPVRPVRASTVAAATRRWRGKRRRAPDPHRDGERGRVEGDAPRVYAPPGHTKQTTAIVSVAGAGTEQQRRRDEERVLSIAIFADFDRSLERNEPAPIARTPPVRASQSGPTCALLRTLRGQVHDRTRQHNQLQCTYSRCADVIGPQPTCHWSPRSLGCHGGLGPENRFVVRLAPEEWRCGSGRSTHPTGWPHPADRRGACPTDRWIGCPPAMSPYISDFGASTQADWRDRGG